MNSFALAQSSFGSPVSVLKYSLVLQSHFTDRFTSRSVFIRCSLSGFMMFYRFSISNFRFMPSKALVKSSRRRCVISFLAETVRSITILVPDIANICSVADLFFRHAAWIGGISASSLSPILRTMQTVKIFLKLIAEWLLEGLMVDLQVFQVLVCSVWFPSAVHFRASVMEVLNIIIFCYS